MFIDGLRFAVPWLAFWLLPLLVALLLSGLLQLVELGALAYLLVAVVFLAAPVLFCAALYRLQTRSDFSDLLDIALIFRMSFTEAPRFIIPALVYVGLFALALPLYGFPFFIGFLLLITFTGLRYAGHRLDGRGGSVFRRV